MPGPAGSASPGPLHHGILWEIENKDIAADNHHGRNMVYGPGDLADDTKTIATTLAISRIFERNKRSRIEVVMSVASVPATTRLQTHRNQHESVR